MLNPKRYAPTSPRPEAQEEPWGSSWVLEPYAPSDLHRCRVGEVRGSGRCGNSGQEDGKKSGLARNWGFGVWVLGFRAWGSGFRVWGFRGWVGKHSSHNQVNTHLRVSASTLGLGFRVQGGQ